MRVRPEPKADENATRGTTVRRVLAHIVYTAGTVLCLTLVVSVLNRLAHGASLVESLSLVMVLIPWWITAGLGVRLGVEPRDYFRSLGRFLGI